MIKKIMVSALLLLSFVWVGCEIIPQPMMLIEAPVQERGPAKDIIRIARGFLPKGAQFASAIEPKGVSPVISVDLSGDGTKEIFATYRVSNHSSVVNGMVLQYKEDKWTKVLVVDEPIKHVAADNIAPGNGLELLLGIGPQWSDSNVLRSYWMKNGILEKLTDFPYDHFTLWQEGKHAEKRLVVFNKVSGFVDFYEFPTMAVIFLEKREDHLIMKESVEGLKRHAEDYLKELSAFDTLHPGLPFVQLVTLDYLILQKNFDNAYQLMLNIHLLPEQHYENIMLQQNLFAYYYHKKDYPSAEKAMKDLMQMHNNRFSDPGLAFYDMKDIFIYDWVLNHTEEQAQVLLALGKKQEAIALYEKSIRLIEKNRKQRESMSLNSLTTSYFTEIGILEDALATTSQLEAWKQDLARLKG